MNARTLSFGVEEGVFTPLRRNAELRRDLLNQCEQPETGLLLVGVGRHTPEKNWPMVIEAAVAAGARREVALLQIGEGRDTSALVKAISGNPHVQLMRPITERPVLAQLLASADGLIHGCDAETFCFVAAEAAASGIPVIAPSTGAAKDAAGGATIRYSAGNVLKATSAIGHLMDNREIALGVAREWALRSKRTMDDHFDELFGAYDRSLRKAA